MVGARVGRRLIGWPFGRLDVADDALVLRFLASQRHGPRNAPKGAVEKVRVRRKYFRTFLDIDDSLGVFKGVSLEIPFGIKGIISELNDCDYQVIDLR